MVQNRAMMIAIMLVMVNEVFGGCIRHFEVILKEFNCLKWAKSAQVARLGRLIQL